jgi:uncharacterized metal-binding protein YceD (DUF177 family)
MKATDAVQPTSPELFRPFAVARLSEDGEPFRFEANPAERKALAARFDLIELPSLTAEGRIAAFDRGHGVRVEGILRAEVVQACVVTLEPVAARIEEPFMRIYTARPLSQATEQETVLDMAEDDPPDPLDGGVVDVGEAVAETFGLALDPYPRAPGAELSADGAGEGPPSVANCPGNERKSPFSALKGLINKSR